MALTKREVDRLTYDPDGPKRQVTYDTAGESDKDPVPGFGVAVSPSGVRTFILQYRPAGSAIPRRLTIGRYGALTLDQARAEARKALYNAQYGKDPVEAKQEARRGETLKDLAHTYVEREAKKLKTGAEVERLINKHILPALGGKRVKSITTADISKLHYAIGDRTPVEANRVRGVLHRMFECGRKWGYAPQSRVNPVKDVDPFPESDRERFADAQELPLLWKAIEAEPDPHNRVLFKLLLFTGCRRGELLGLRWKDVDVSGRRLRLPDTKAGKPATVPLSDPALAVLAELDRGIGDAPVFPITTTKRAWDRVRTRLWLAQNPDQEKRLRRAAEKSIAEDPKHASRRPERVEARLLKLALPHAKKGEDRLTLHDLRRSAGSLMALHLAPTVVGKVLRNPTAVPIYTRIADQEARLALEEHGRRLTAIVMGEGAG